MIYSFQRCQGLCNQFGGSTRLNLQSLRSQLFIHSSKLLANKVLRTVNTIQLIRLLTISIGQKDSMIYRVAPNAADKEDRAFE